MIWTKLTVHGTISDCGLGKVSVYTQSKDCVGLRCVDYIQVLKVALRAYVLGHKGRGLIALSGIRLQQ